MSPPNVRAVQIVRLIAAAGALAAGGAAALAIVVSAAVSGNCFEGAGSNCDSTTSPGWGDAVGPLLAGMVLLVPVLAIAAWIALGTPTTLRLGRLRFSLLATLLVPSYVSVAVGTYLISGIVDLEAASGIATAGAIAVGYLAAWLTLASWLASRRQVPAPEH